MVITITTKSLPEVAGHRYGPVTLGDNGGEGAYTWKEAGTAHGAHPELERVS